MENRIKIMKGFGYIFLACVIVFAIMTIVGCGGDGDNGLDGQNTIDGYTAIDGYIQKGPFVSGSSITIQELDNSLNPTGVTYGITTSDDFGAFSLGNQIASRYIEVIASGFYFDEVGGELSVANITLRVISDLSISENVNVNILTTLEKDRIKYLMANEELIFTEARFQAETEILNIFNISRDNIPAFDQMDISQEGIGNAILLAISAILQAHNTVAELSELISKIGIDIKEDGMLDNYTYIDEISNNSMNLDLDAVRTNLYTRYESLGLTVTIPSFEDYVDSDGDGIINIDDDDLVYYVPGNASAIPGIGEVEISWDGVSEAAEYNIYWATESGVSKDNYIGKIENIFETSYTHNRLTYNVTYYYVITGENPYYESEESNEISAVPYAPSIETVPGIGQVEISWDSIDEATEYNIYWATWSGVSKTNYEGKIENISTTSYTHTGLTYNTTYYYVITGTNSGWESDQSDEVYAVPYAPSVPENVSAIPGIDQVEISWDSVDEATNYNIYWATWSGVSKTNYEGKIENISTTSYTHTGLTYNTTYYYVVTGESISWESNESDEVLAVTLTPPVPENVNAIPGGYKIKISWDSIDEATEYNIYWATWSGVSKTNYEGKIENISTTSYTHTGLTYNTTYYYVITAKSTYWESNESDEAFAVALNYPDTVVDTIPVDNDIFGLAVTPDHSYIYVIKWWDLDVFRTSDYTVHASLEIDRPKGITLTSDGSYVYVTNNYDDTVLVIQTSDNTIIDTINVGDGPRGITVTPDGSYIYVGNYSDGTISVVQTSDNTVIDTINIGNGPRGIKVTPDGSYVYVSNSNDDTVTVIQTSDNSVIDTINVGDGPWDIKVTPDGSYVYVTIYYDDTVSVIQTSDNSVIDTINVGSRPCVLTVTPDGSYIYVGNYNNDTVSVIQTSDNSVIDTITVGVSPNSMAVSPDGSYVYVGTGTHFSVEGEISVLGF